MNNNANNDIKSNVFNDNDVFNTQNNTSTPVNNNGNISNQQAMSATQSSNIPQNQTSQTSNMPQNSASSQPINSVNNTASQNPNLTQAQSTFTNGNQPQSQNIEMPKLTNEEVVGTIKKDTQKSPVSMLILFSVLIISIFIIPEITPYFSDILKIFQIDDNSSILDSNRNDTTTDNNKQNSDTNKDNTNNEENKTTYYNIDNTTAITFSNLTIKELKKETVNNNYYLTYKIVNNSTNTYSFDTHRIYFDLYNADKTYIGRVLITAGEINANNEINAQSILNETEYNNATMLEVLERTAADYQSVNLKNNQLTCKNNTNTTIYTFKSNALTNIDDTYTYTVEVQDNDYVTYSINTQNTVNTLNTKNGVSAAFANINNVFGFTKNIKIDYANTEEDLTSYDKTYYKKDTAPSTVKYELESMGYKCE